MDELRLEVEANAAAADRIATELQVRLGLRVEVAAVASGSLPRFEGKARRFIDQREERSA
jgi:phenylacetate-CoA ligase